MQLFNLIEKYSYAFIALLLCSTAYFTCFAADDYYFIYLNNTSSFCEAYKHITFEWHGRWIYNALMLILIKFHSFSFMLFVYFSSSFVLLFLSLKHLFKGINTKLNTSFNTNQFSFITLCILFFSTSNTNESWFWLTASVNYVLSLICFIYLIGYHLNNSSTAIIKYLLSIICIAYISANNEPLFVISIALLVFKLFKHFNYKQLVLMLVAIGCFALNLLSSGSQHRFSITPEISLINIVLYTVYGTLKTLILSNPLHNILAIFFAIPFYIYGYKKQPKISFKYLLNSLYILLIISLLNHLITTIALGGLGPDRAFLITALAKGAFISICMLYAGKKYKIYNKYMNIIPFVLLLILNAYYIPLHYKFNTSYKLRIKHIKNNVNSSTIKVGKLPKSGLIYHAELSSDTTYFVNKHLQKALNSNPVKLK